MGDLEDTTFLAFTLRSCSHPFPFRSLSYEATDKKVWHDSSQHTGNRKSQFARKREETGEILETDPTVAKQKRSAAFTSKHQFPDLKRKQVWRKKIEAMAKADVFLRHADGSLEQIALGESNSAADAAGVDVEERMGKDQHEERLPWFAQEGIRIIAGDPRDASPRTTINVVCPTGETKPIFNLPMIINEDGEIDRAVLITLAGDRTRPRQGCFVEVQIDKIFQRYMLVLEGRSTKNPSIITVHENALSVELISNIGAESSSETDSARL